MKTFKITKNSQYIQSIQLDKGTYTYSCNVKSDATVLTIAFQNTMGVWTDFEIPILSGMWNKKAKLTFELKERAVNFDLCKYASNESKVYVQAPMLEEGTNASTPKSNDLDDLEEIDNNKSQIKAFNQTFEDLENYIDGAFKDGIIDSAEAKAIEKYKNTINEAMARAEASYLKVYANTYLEDTAFNTPKSDLRDAKINLWGQSDILLATIDTAIADGKTTVDEKNAVDSAFNLFNNLMSAFQSALEEANKAIQVKLDDISKGRVDNLEIGGRNYAQNSKYREKPLGVAFTVLVPEGVELDPNATYTLSFEYEYLDELNSPSSMLLYRDEVMGGIPIIDFPKGEIIYTFKHDGIGNSYEGLLMYGADGPALSLLRSVIYRNIKLEKGNKATDWTPAPEDIQAEIEDIATIKDTRNDNQPPAWYYTNYPKTTVKELKLCSVIGITGESTLCTLESVIRGADSSGGAVIQTATTDSGKQFVRSGAVGWTQWRSDQISIEHIEAITDNFTTSQGGLFTPVTIALREAETHNVTAGMSGIQGDNEEKPAFWAGGTYDGAKDNTAKAIIRHDGSSKFTDTEVTGVINATSGIFKGALSSPFERTTNLYGEAFSNNLIVTGDFTLPWDQKGSGRLIRLIQPKPGTAICTAPAGFYFFEDGVQKSSLKMIGAEIIELLGYTDKNGVFIGWLALNRGLMNTVSTWGEPQRIVAQGRYKTNNPFKYHTFDGSTITAYTSGGFVSITMPEHWFDSKDGYYVKVFSNNGVNSAIHAVSNYTGYNFGVQQFSINTFDNNKINLVSSAFDFFFEVHSAARLYAKSGSSGMPGEDW